MKSKIAIIVLSVALALTVLVSAGLCLYLPYRAVHDAEMVWDHYLFSCNFSGIDPDYQYTGSGTHTTLRCMHSESFDLPPEKVLEKGEYGAGGIYVYDLLIYPDGSGKIIKKQYFQVVVEHIDPQYWTSSMELIEEVEISLTAEEVQSVLDVVDESCFDSLPTHVPELYYAMDGRYTTVILSRPFGQSHMVAAYNAEEGDAVYDIRMAIEELLKAHDGGRLPEPPVP